MKPFSTILVPLDGSTTAARSLECATWLAGRLGARLHILNATDSPHAPREELERLKVPEELWANIELHQAAEYPEQAILDAIERHGIELVVMTARGEAAEEGAAAAEPVKLVGHVTRTVIERSTIPVLVLSQRCEQALPWKSALVPVSGGLQADEAVTVAVRLGSALGLDVHVAHVTDARSTDDGLESVARYADAPHHEYPQQLEEFVRRALPQCAADECRAIKDVALCRGDVADELLKMVERKHVSMVIVAWKGRFMKGHARVLKQLLQATQRPLLLVKPAARTPFRLKVGEDLE